MGSKKSKSEQVEEEDFLKNNDLCDNLVVDNGVGVHSLPYTVVKKPAKPFNDLSLRRWIPNSPVQFRIRETCTRCVSRKIRCWYTLELEHGRFRWDVAKRYRDFLQLHRQLQMFRTILSLQIPEIKLERGRDGRRATMSVKKKEVPKLPLFPPMATYVQNRTDLVWKMAVLESYMKEVLDIPVFKDYYKTLEFLDVGPFSFVEDLGLKGKEGFVRSRTNCGDTRAGVLCTRACGFWKKRWMFMKENFVGLIDPSTGELESVMLLDRFFRIERQHSHSDVLIIKNLYRNLILQCESKHQASEWLEELSFVMGRGLNDFVIPNMYKSFAPPRSLTECKWIVDGATYFEAVALSMEAAKEEIFIANWWLSPEIYLRRPTTQGHYWQLDYLLRRKARQGVKIYVLLYKEFELALGINSLYTEEKLSRMHPNIQVLRHPFLTEEVQLLWAHHEKIVCVDQTFAFVGGLDLCYGRWDDYQHRLTDLGEIEERLRVQDHMMPSTTKPLSEEQNDFKASSLSNVRDTPDLVQDDRETTPLQTREGGKLDKTTKTLNFKSAFRKYQAAKVFEGIRRNLSAENLGTDPEKKFCYSEQPSDQHRIMKELALIRLGLELKYQLWHGKDYVNFINKDFVNLNEPYSDFIDRKTTTRMPWHDIGLFAQGMVARDIARSFILRWNHVKVVTALKNNKKPLLIPKCYSNILDNLPPFLQDTVGPLHRAECQVLRSLSFWSSHIQKTEYSIHRAYLWVIRESQKFIYIENQFFISQPNGSSSVFNGIADALFNRILRAHRNQKDFHVYVVMPLLPAFEGELGTATGTLMQAIMHWNYKSICRGCTSLKIRLSKHMTDTSKYINFYGLRTHGTLENKPVTELVYIHSKCLVADDRVAIIGSANINDRSMLGYRDSEIAVIIKDTSFLDDPNGAGQFCYSLRSALFKEHLGLMKNEDPEIDLKDPNSTEFIKDVWIKIAVTNTKIYEEVFRVVPTDNVRSFEQLKKYKGIENLASTDPEAAKEKLKSVRGYIVMFPLFFLDDENLEPQFQTKEHFLPSGVFT